MVLELLLMILDRGRVSRASMAAYVAAAAGAVALVCIALFFTVGEPFGTLNDIALLVMALAIGPIMLGSYELGGVTPLLPARVSLAGGIGAMIVWSLVQAAMIARLVTFDDYAPARGRFLVDDLSL